MRRKFGTACAVVVVAMLNACTSAPAPEESASGGSVSPGPLPEEPGELARYYDQELDWYDCGQRLQCTELTVPRDYDDPAAGDIGIAVTRYSTGSGSKGALVFNPGGPGGSGVDFAKVAQYIVSPALLADYDFVGFDPRGVGGSEPVDCLTDEQTDDVLATDADPTTPEQVAELEADAEMFATGCERNSGDMIAHVDSGSVVRDMDILRAALGEEKLDYLGKSYGTKLGLLYAEQFGPRVGRMVLDGVLPPELGPDEVSLGQAKGFEDSLRRFVEWCQGEQDCPVTGESVDDGVAQIQAWLAALETEPIPAGDRDLTQSLGLQSVLYLLYYPYSGDWQTLKGGLADAFEGDGTALLRVLDQRLERAPDGQYRNNGNSYDSFVAITCLDGGGEPDSGTVAETAAQWRTQAPTFGAALAWSGLVCGNWPAGPDLEPQEVTADQSGLILVVTRSHDPATPAEWARQTADRLADARLVTLEGDGHTAYFTGSDCLDEVVDEFLVSDTVPEDGIVCDD